MLPETLCGLFPTNELRKIQAHEFPPSPPPCDLKESVIQGWCRDSSPENFIEGGCAVCGQLTPMKYLSKLSDYKGDLNILSREGMGRGFLPPSIEDLDEVLAFNFTGPIRLSPKDLERTPLLVRRRRVAAALEWLKLNHADYLNLDISYDNLENRRYK